MVEKSKIEWTHHTFNPWWGCARVSPGCGGGTPGDLKGGCYAEAFANRLGLKVWGQQAPRRFFGDKHWAEPLRWNERAAKAGERQRVFCASMADVFEDRADLVEHRQRLWRTIDATPWLDWLLVTKRIENVAGMWDDAIKRCWLGVTAEDQQRADERIPVLLRTPAAVRFVSAEPLLGPLDIERYLDMDGNLDLDEWGEWVDGALDWVIVGGESGPGARPCCLSWLRNIVHDCEEAGVPLFMKQLGAKPYEARDDAPDDQGRWEPEAWLRLDDKKGGDMEEWRALGETYLCVRQFPEVRRG